MTSSSGADIVAMPASIPVAGLSYQGKPPRGAATVRISRSWDSVARGDGQYFAALLLTHEIGHTLGLDHPKRASTCTVMNSAFAKACKHPDWPADTWMCGILQSNDRAALVKLYSGKVKKMRTWFCPLPAPAPLKQTVQGAGVDVVGGDGGRAAVIHWTPVPGLRMVVERRDARCSEITAQMIAKTMEDADADNTLDAALGTANDPFATATPMTACYSLTLIDAKSGAKTETVNVEANLLSSGAPAPA